MLLRNIRLRPSETLWYKGVFKQNTYVGLTTQFGITTNGKCAIFHYRYYIAYRNIRDIRERDKYWCFESSTFTAKCINNCINIGNSLYINAIALVRLQIVIDVTVIKN